MNTFKIVMSSANRKTGDIMQTYTDSSSCPKSCAAYDGCYAKSGYARFSWDKTDKSVDDLVKVLSGMSVGTLWRHNIAGDLAGIDEDIDTGIMDKIINANKRRKLKGFTYSHKKSDSAIAYIKNANQKGFTINVSCDSIEEVKKFHAMGLPCVTIANTGNKVDKLDNIKMVQCPAEYNDKITCKTCAMCANGNRDYVIKFTPHGIAKKKIVPIVLAK